MLGLSVQFVGCCAGIVSVCLSTSARFVDAGALVRCLVVSPIRFVVC